MKQANKMSQRKKRDTDDKNGVRKNGVNETGNDEKSRENGKKTRENGIYLQNGVIQRCHGSWMWHNDTEMMKKR